MNFSNQQRDPRRHLFGFGAVMLFHLILGYALVNGLARKVVDVLESPLEVKIIAELVPTPPPPPPKPAPPAPKVVAPPAYVPPPEVQVQAPAPPAIGVVTNNPPPTPSAPAPEVPPAPPIVQVGVVCPNHVEVRSNTPYPTQAQRQGLSGEVIVELTVKANGEVADIAVVRSTSPLFNNTATQAVSKLRCLGQGQAVRVRVPFVFKLEG